MRSLSGLLLSSGSLYRKVIRSCFDEPFIVDATEGIYRSTWNVSVTSVLSVDCVVVVCLPLLPWLSNCVPLA